MRFSKTEKILLLLLVAVGVVIIAFSFLAKGNTGSNQLEPGTYPAKDDVGTYSEMGFLFHVVWVDDDNNGLKSPILIPFDDLERYDAPCGVSNPREVTELTVFENSDGSKRYLLEHMQHYCN